MRIGRSRARAAALAVCLLLSGACASSVEPEAHAGRETLWRQEHAWRQSRQVARLVDEARAGDPRAQAFLGLLHLVGEGVPRNHAEAATWFRLAAEQDEYVGQYHLGMLYLEGSGVPRDIEQASRWLRKAADHPDAERRVGLIALGRWLGSWPGGRVRTARGDEREGARLADARASGDRMLAIGLAHLDGRAPRDPQQAARWFRMAARQDHPEAQWRLGLAYRDGEGVGRDLRRAHMWFNLASAGGHGPARDDLDELEATLDASEVAEAQFMAREWRRRRERQTSADAVESDLRDVLPATPGSR